METVTGIAIFKATGGDDGRITASANRMLFFTLSIFLPHFLSEMGLFALFL